MSSRYIVETYNAKTIFGNVLLSNCNPWSFPNCRQNKRILVFGGLKKKHLTDAVGNTYILGRFIPEISIAKSIFRNILLSSYDFGSIPNW